MECSNCGCDIGEKPNPRDRVNGEPMCHVCFLLYTVESEPE